MQTHMLALQKLHRKRILGSGPYGALQAAFTPDDESIVTQFKVCDYEGSRGGSLGKRGVPTCM